MKKIENISTSELVQLAHELMKELQKRYEKSFSSSEYVTFTQRKGNIKRNAKGVPLDRPFWAFVPFLGEETRRMLQPQETEEGKIYRLPLSLIG